MSKTNRIQQMLIKSDQTKVLKETTVEVKVGTDFLFAYSFLCRQTRDLASVLHWLDLWLPNHSTITRKRRASPITHCVLLLLLFILLSLLLLLLLRIHTYFYRTTYFYTQFCFWEIFILIIIKKTKMAYHITLIKIYQLRI